MSQQHSLPLFGHWLYLDFSPESYLSATPSTPEFARLSKGVLTAAQVETSWVEAHRIRFLRK
jgi:hypothetical protein